jgi:N-acetylmuramoyl-L-alanine amidase
MNRAAIKALLPWLTMVLIIWVCVAVVWLRVGQMRRHTHPHKSCPIVCIDPGHPSETNSAMHEENGTTELRMNWEMAGNLAAALASKGITTVLTKKTCDQFTSNRERAMIANDCRADLAVHLHCDAGPGKGYTIYFPNRQGTIDAMTGPPQSVIDGSRRAAYLMHSGMAGPLSGLVHDRGVKGDDKTKIGRKYGTLTTSAFSEVPTITVEMVFLTNSHDADFIKSRGGQSKMTDALAAGVVMYLEANGYVERDGKLIPRRPAAPVE